MILRVYKNGATEYESVTSAIAGGYTDLKLTSVRNEPGLLEVTLKATTIAMLHTWLDEAATIELWDDADAVRLGIFTVDEYHPRWEKLTCSLSCPGILVAAKTTPISGTYSAHTAKQLLEHIVADVPEILWNGDLITGADGTVDQVKWEDVAAFDCMSELATLKAFDLWVDADGYLNTAPWATDDDLTFTLNQSAWSFDTVYTARNIVNRLLLRTNALVSIFDHAASQAIYGVRQRAFSTSGIVTQATAQEWADNAFLQLAYPVQQMTVAVAHNAENRPGRMAKVLGLADGRTYNEIIAQVEWEEGASDDVLHIGHQPPTLVPPKPLDGKNANATIATALNAWVSEAVITAEMTLSWEGAPPGTWATPEVILQKLDGENGWVKIGAELVTWTAGGMYTCSFAAITPPGTGSDRYRCLYAGNGYHSPCFSNEIEVTPDEFIDGWPGFGPEKHLVTDAESVIRWADQAEGGTAAYLGTMTDRVYDTSVNECTFISAAGTWSNCPVAEGIPDYGDALEIPAWGIEDASGNKIVFAVVGQPNGI